MDIVFGIAGDIHGPCCTINSGPMESWLYDDVLPNIKTEGSATNSRVGIITFWGGNVYPNISLGEYTEGTLITKITDELEWTISGHVNTDPLMDEVLVQFDTISASPNSQQILVLIVDDSPRSSSAIPIPICQYKQALDSRGILRGI